ncbi:MAG: hypothetical protein IJD33_06545 [Clostridia bacterium]|nr:hypothetical protein [Clostridia bacterium]
MRILFCMLSPIKVADCALLNAALASPALGVTFVLLLFGICFFCIHVARLAKFGWKYQRQTRQTDNAAANKTASSNTSSNTSPNASNASAFSSASNNSQKKAESENGEKKAPAENAPQEPVYYIVEKKRRTNTTFSEPKRIHFK